MTDPSPPPAEAPDLEADLARDPAFLDAIKDDAFASAVFALFQNHIFYKGGDARGWLCGWRQAARLVCELRGLGESNVVWLHAEFDGDWPEEPRQALALPRRYADFLAGNATERAPVRPESLRIVATLHAHLARLGWRPASDEDKAREYRDALRRRIAVLREIERRGGEPEAPAPEWAKLFSGTYSLSHHTDWVRTDVLDRMSADEREATPRFHSLERRLVGLAVSGRVSQADFERMHTELVQSRFFVRGV